MLARLNEMGAVLPYSWCLRRAGAPAPAAYKMVRRSVRPESVEVNSFMAS